MSRYVISNGNPCVVSGLGHIPNLTCRLAHTSNHRGSPAREGGPLTLALRAELRSGHNPQGGAKRMELDPPRQG